MVNLVKIFPGKGSYFFYWTFNGQSIEDFSRKREKSLMNCERNFVTNVTMHFSRNDRVCPCVREYCKIDQGFDSNPIREFELIFRVSEGVKVVMLKTVEDIPKNGRRYSYSPICCKKCNEFSTFTSALKSVRAESLQYSQMKIKAKNNKFKSAFYLDPRRQEVTIYKFIHIYTLLSNAKKKIKQPET